MTELETRLLNVAYQLQDVYQDIEAYCPPDDSESWSEDTPSLFASRDELEEEFRGLIDTIRQEAVKDYMKYCIE